MLFNSFEFLVFFIVVTIAYYKLPHRYRWMLLLASSCYFYMAFVPIYILILAGTIVIDYFAGIYIENSNKKRKLLLLYASLIANIGILVVFKYYNFFIENISLFLSGLGYTNPIPYLSILLPIGLSFHTFQAMSYTIEVYRGRQKAEKHFGYYALYVMFYPQLVAGPIERPQNILHQLKTPAVYKENEVVKGLQIMLWGVFKKVVVADRLGVLVDAVYADPSGHSGLSNLVATLFFSIEIYCDFSGYSDIAIGTAKCLGIDLMKNFNVPYISKSITEFWQRWHISLSTWFRDYLYIPLGGSRVSQLKIIRNIFIVFIISGIWHGANWTFVVWGAIHGFLVALERLTKRIKFPASNKLVNAAKILFTFLLVSCTWVFFRARSLTDAGEVFKAVFTDLHINKASISDCIILMTGDSTSLSHFIICISVIFFMLFMEFKTRLSDRPIFSDGSRKQFAFYTFLLFLTLFFGYFKNTSFIYFQF
ncbi:MAG: MBOAT family O-acyltransferase [Bacteroidota bacterium]